jgi:pantothenate kinase
VLLRQYQSIDELTTFCAGLGLSQGSIVRSAGGGGHKFNGHFQDVLGVLLEPVPEIDALVAGLHACLSERDDEAYHFGKGHQSFAGTLEQLFPYILVNLGSGVSFVLVSDEDVFKRINGSTMGGATFHGLATLLTDISDYAELMKMLGSADKKESISGTSADLTVADIYGKNDCAELGLPAELLASSFGRVPQVSHQAAGVTADVHSTRRSGGSGGSGGSSSGSGGSSSDGGGSGSDGGGVGGGGADSSNNGSSSVTADQISTDNNGDTRKSFDKVELLSGLMTMMALNLAQVACLEAELKGVSTVVLAGGWLAENDMLKEVGQSQSVELGVFGI